MIIRIDKYNVFFVLATIVLLKPTYFDSIPFLDKSFSILGMLIFLVEIYLYFKLVGYVSDQMLIWTFVFALIPVIATVIYGGNLFSALSLFSHYVGTYILCKLETVHNKEALFTITLPIVEIIAAINFITMIVFPQGMYRIVRSTGWASNRAWFLGLRNGHPFWMCLLCMILFMKNNVKDITFKNVIEEIVIIGIVEYSLINNGGSAALVAAGLVLVYVVFRKLLSHCSLQWVYLIFNYLFFGLVVVLQVHRNILSNIVGLLKRNVTFTGRTFVWRAALDWVKKSPIFGWGIEDDWTIFSKIGVTGDKAFIKCHNIFVDVLYSGGVITFILFSIMLILIIVKNMHTDKRIFSCVAWFMFFMTLLLGQTETAITSNAVIFILFISYFAGEWKVPNRHA